MFEEDQSPFDIQSALMEGDSMLQGVKHPALETFKNSKSMNSKLFNSVQSGQNIQIDEAEFHVNENQNI